MTAPADLKESLSVGPDCGAASFVADGMPTGLQIVGHQHGDLRTVELTAWVEDLLGLDPIAPAFSG